MKRKRGHIKALNCRGVRDLSMVETRVICRHAVMIYFLNNFPGEKLTFVGALSFTLL